MASQQSQETPVVDPVPSKRWTQFYAALQLAIQRAAHKWTLVFFSLPSHPDTHSHIPNSFIHSYKDFSECFPLWCEEQPSGAEGVFNTVSSFIETHIVVRRSFPSDPRRLMYLSFLVARTNKTNTNKLYEQYEVQKNLDTLHQVVTEARARRQRQRQQGSDSSDAGGGGGGKGIWRADLQPRAAVRARMIPALERERDLLRARLADVRSSFLLSLAAALRPVRTGPRLA
jgi:hypothetical protein